MHARLTLTTKSTFYLFYAPDPTVFSSAICDAPLQSPSGAAPPLTPEGGIRSHRLAGRRHVWATAARVDERAARLPRRRSCRRSPTPSSARATGTSRSEPTKSASVARPRCLACCCEGKIAKNKPPRHAMAFLQILKDGENFPLQIWSYKTFPQL